MTMAMPGASRWIIPKMVEVKVTTKEKTQAKAKAKARPKTITILICLYKQISPVSPMW